MLFKQKPWWHPCLFPCANNNFNAIAIAEIRNTKKKISDFTLTEAKTVIGTLLMIHLINPVNSSIYTKRIN